MMIRQFKPEDASGCSTVIRDCIETDSRTALPLRRKLLLAESPEHMQERANLYYIAVCDVGGSIVGVGGVDMNEIRILFIDPRYRRRSLGREILTHLEAMIPAALFPDIFVYSTRSAVGFYRACGYEAGGEYDFDVDGEIL